MQDDEDEEKRETVNKRWEVFIIYSVYMIMYMYNQSNYQGHGPTGVYSNGYKGWVVVPDGSALIDCERESNKEK